MTEESACLSCGRSTYLSIVDATAKHYVVHCKWCEASSTHPLPACETAKQCILRSISARTLKPCDSRKTAWEQWARENTTQATTPFLAFCAGFDYGQRIAQTLKVKAENL